MMPWAPKLPAHVWGNRISDISNDVADHVCHQILKLADDFIKHRPRHLLLLVALLEELELQKEELEQQMTREGADMAKLSHDLADLISRIEQAEERWLELSELAP